MGLYDSNNMSSSNDIYDVFSQVRYPEERKKMKQEEAKLAYEWSEEQRLLRKIKKELAETRCELCGSKKLCNICLGLTEYKNRT